MTSMVRFLGKGGPKRRSPREGGRWFQGDLTIENKGGGDICMPRRPSLAVVKKMGYCGAHVIRFLGIRISTVGQLTGSNGLLEVDIYLNHFGCPPLQSTAQ